MKLINSRSYVYRGWHNHHTKWKMKWIWRCWWPNCSTENTKIKQQLNDKKIHLDTTFNKNQSNSLLCYSTSLNTSWLTFCQNAKIREDKRICWDGVVSECTVCSSRSSSAQVMKDWWTGIINKNQKPSILHIKLWTTADCIYRKKLFHVDCIYQECFTCLIWHLFVVVEKPAVSKVQFMRYLFSWGIFYGRGGGGGARWHLLQWNYIHFITFLRKSPGFVRNYHIWSNLLEHHLVQEGAAPP